MGKDAPTQRDLQNLQAPLLAACWAAAGFRAARPEVLQTNWPNNLEISYLAREGDLLSERKMWLRLHGGGKLTTMPKGLAFRLLTQPWAASGMLGLLVLAYGSFSTEPAVARLAGALGGQALGRFVLAGAALAHAAEGAYAYSVLTTTLRQPLGAALGWASPR